MGQPDKDDTERGYDFDSDGRVVAMCSASPGWWAIYREHGSEAWRSPIATWIVTESVVRMEGGRAPGRLRRYHSIYGVDVSGEGFDGSCLGDSPSEYAFQPDWHPSP